MKVWKTAIHIPGIGLTEVEHDDPEAMFATIRSSVNMGSERQHITIYFMGQRRPDLLERLYREAMAAGR